MMELHRTFAALTLMVGCAVAEGQQIAVRVRTEKLTNPLGEPVFVLVELTNISSRTVQFADDGTCAQSFKAVFPLEHRMADRLYGCAGGGIAGSCGGSFVDLKAGESVVRRYLLPDRLEPGYAGDFNYTLQKQIRFYARDGSHKMVGSEEVSETIAVHLVQANQARMEADYAPLLSDLQSTDPQKHWLALMAITEHPQGFLEPVVLKLSQDPQTMSASITGLKKLGTERTKQRLAELTGSEYGESVRQPATTALAESGDGAYCDLMLQLMTLHQGYASEIAARGAGLLCGEKAVPQLASLLNKPNSLPAYEIAYALGSTGSRAAVPILIVLLSNADAGVRGAAKEALYTLTHRQSTPDDPGADHQDWVSWWALQGKTAQIFDPAECP